MVVTGFFAQCNTKWTVIESDLSNVGAYNCEMINDGTTTNKLVQVKAHNY